MKTTKYRLAFLASCLLLLSACGNLEKGVSKVDQGEKTSGGSITTGRVDSSVYQAIMEDGKYQTSAARELTASNMNSGYNQENFETGLLRLSHQTFSVDKFYFQEGQKISEEKIKQWLGRQSDDNPEGLNPDNANDPIIFQQLLEQDYLKEDGKTFGGLSLGFAFNSVYYDGDKSTEISRDQIMANARKSVNAVLTRVRKLPGLDKVPIVVGLFEQAAKEDIQGGRYIYAAVSENGSTTIDKFEQINEKHLSLPVLGDQKNIATEDGLNTKFVSFQNAVQNFFPDLAGVTGRAYYVDDQLQSLAIQIDSKYYSKTEVNSFSQFVGKQVESIFETTQGTIEVQINSIEGPQAFVARKGDKNEIISYVFN